MITFYGIPNCDTVKKARHWLESAGIAYAFHDYKKSGIDRATLDRWAEETGWELLLNRAGTSYRKLPDAAKADLDRERAMGLLIGNPSMIKRPVVEGAGPLLVGFAPDRWLSVLR